MLILDREIFLIENLWIEILFNDKNNKLFNINKN